MIAKVVLFQLQGQSRALLLAAIDEILLAPAVFRLPLLSANFAGVFLHKGQLIPVLIPECLVPAAASRPRATAEYFIVCTTEFGPVGLPADRVLRIVAQTAGQLEAAGRFCFEGEHYPLVELETLIGLQPCNQG
jgi:chemotaxis signal transduction protein